MSYISFEKNIPNYAIDVIYSTASLEVQQNTDAITSVT